MVEENDVIKIWSEEDTVFKKTTYSRNTVMMSDLSKMETWGDCYVGNKDLKLAVIGKPSSLNAKFEVEAKIELNEEQRAKILKDINNIQLKESVDGLAYNSDMVLIAMKARGDNSIWFSTDECIDLMEPLTYETLINKTTNNNEDYLLSIGDYLFYVNDSFQIKTIMAIIMDFYCDKAMPALKGKHDTVSFQGAGLMSVLLATQMGHTNIGNIGNKRVYDEIDKAVLLPNVLHKWHMGLTDKVDSNDLEELFVEFLQDKSKEIKSDESKKEDQAKLSGLDFDKELEEPKSTEITVTRDMRKSKSDPLDVDNYFGTFLLSELIQNGITQSDIVVMYNGVFPVLADCDIEIENQNIHAKIESEEIICGMVENGILFIVTDDGLLDPDTIGEMEEVLTAENVYLEEILIVESLSADGIEVQTNFNAMFAGQYREVKTDD